MKNQPAPQPKRKTVVAHGGRLFLGALLLLGAALVGGGLDAIRANPNVQSWFADPFILMFLAAALLPLLALLFRKSPFFVLILFTVSLVLTGIVRVGINSMITRLVNLGVAVPAFDNWVGQISQTTQGVMSLLLYVALGGSWLFAFLGSLTPKAVKAGKFFTFLFTLALFVGPLALMALYWYGNRTYNSWGMLESVAVAPLLQLALSFFVGSLGDSDSLGKNAVPGKDQRPGFQPQGFGGRNPNERGISMSGFRQQGGAPNPAFPGQQPGFPPNPQPAYAGYPQAGYPQAPMAYPGYPVPQGYPQQGYYVPQQPAPYPAPSAPAPGPYPASGSRFSGSPLSWLFVQLGGLLISLLTAFIAVPSAVCMKQRFLAKSTWIDGRKVVFDGQTGDLYKKWIGWLFLSVLTAGIFIFFLPAKIRSWVASHTHLA